MANLSNLTRREQVLAYLRARTGMWVDGTELANEKVGGSEGLKRLRELRSDDGYDIRTRKHPDPNRDIYQYRLVPGRIPVVDHVPQTPEAPSVEYITPAQNRTHHAPIDHVRERELKRAAPQPPRSPAGKIRDAIKWKEDGTVEYVPPQRPLIEPAAGQLTIDAPEAALPPPLKFSSLPRKIEYGTVAKCPRCHGKTTRGRTRKEKVDAAGKPTMVIERTRKKSDDGSSLLIDDEGVLLHRDPFSRKARPCERCDGYGIVPNVGVIPMTDPE